MRGPDSRSSQFKERDGYIEDRDLSFSKQPHSNHTPCDTTYMKSTSYNTNIGVTYLRMTSPPLLEVREHRPIELNASSDEFEQNFKSIAKES